MSLQPKRGVAVVTNRLPAVHLAVASGVSPSFASADIGPVIQPLYQHLLAALGAAKLETLGPSIADYHDTANGGIGVHAGFPVARSVEVVPGLEIVDLPGVELAATALHHGSMSTVDVDTVAPIFDWMRAHGFARPSTRASTTWTAPTTSLGGGSRCNSRSKRFPVRDQEPRRLVPRRSTEPLGLMSCGRVRSRCGAPEMRR